MPIAAVTILVATGSSTVALLVPALIGVAALVAAVVMFGLLMCKKDLVFLLTIRLVGITATHVSWA